MSMRTPTITLFLGLLLIAFPARPSEARPLLTSGEREDCRYRLQNLYNELDLLARNAKVDRSDLARQEQDIERLKVYDRIPFEKDVAGLRRGLADSAKESDLRLVSFSLARESRHASSQVPKEIYTDGPSFHFSENQLVDTIPFEVVVSGKKTDASRTIDEWAEAWPDNVLRLAVVKGKPVRRGANWVVSGQAYRFRQSEFPRLMPRDPMALLPGGFRQDETWLATAEPTLWHFVQGIRTLEKRPETPQLYAARGRFLLEGARMELFLRKVLKRHNS